MQDNAPISYNKGVWVQLGPKFYIPINFWSWILKNSSKKYNLSFLCKDSSEQEQIHLQ